MSIKESYGTLLDALYLEMFDLVEQQTRTKINIEKCSNSGQLLLAKTRYIQGSKTIGATQIPTENSEEFSALCHIKIEGDEKRISGVESLLEYETPDKEAGRIEPMHWFSILAPSSLKSAAEQFRKCLKHVVENANVQKEIIAVLNHIVKMKKILLKEYSAK